MIAIRRSTMRVLIFTLVVPFALLSAGCPAPQEMLREYSSLYVAFCGTVQNGEGAAVTGPVTFRMQAVRIPAAQVMTYLGDAMLDPRGVACVNLGRSPFNLNYADIRPADVDVRSLTATVDGVTVSGFFTFVDLNVFSVIRAEGLFDLTQPDPGLPGMLAIFGETVPGPQDLSAAIENTRRGGGLPGGEGTSSPSRRHPVSGSAAI